MASVGEGKQAVRYATDFICHGVSKDARCNACVFNAFTWFPFFAVALPRITAGFTLDFFKERRCIKGSQRS